VGETAIKTTSNKMIKYEKTCSDNQHTFISFVFDTFRFLAQDIVDLLHNVVEIYITTVCFKMIEKQFSNILSQVVLPVDIIMNIDFMNYSL
jgi:uncharacterized Fe-S radical SAM superfamily protein PflX